MRCINKCMVVLCLFSFLVLDVSFAQKAVAKAQGEPLLKITKLFGIGSRGKVETPVYASNQPRGAKPSKLWGKIEVVYDTARSEDDWIDELTIQFYALSLKMDKDGKRIYSLYRRNVHYIDIALGRKPLEHRAAVFLRPTAFERFGELVAVAVEISHKGEIVDKMSDVNPVAKLPTGDWWANPLVIENPLTVQRDDYILDKQNSPFALINIDDYEVTK